MQKNAQHLLNLINQLHDLSKLEGGYMKIEVAKGDIIDYTKTLVQQVQPLANKKQQRLCLIVKQKIWMTHFDKDKWNKIIFNLLSNAIKFTPENGAIQLTLTKVIQPKKTWIYLIVKDSGLSLIHISEPTRPY